MMNANGNLQLLKDQIEAYNCLVKSEVELRNQIDSNGLSELPIFCLNNATNRSNGTNPSNEFKSTGRKRIRTMSDSSNDDEHIKKQPNIKPNNNNQQQQQFQENKVSS